MAPMGRSRAVLLTTGLVVVAVVLLLGWKGYDYVEHDPAFCNSCHLMNTAYDKWLEGEHAEVGCHDCHKQDLGDRATIVFSSLLRDHDSVPPHTRLTAEPCLGCHRSEDPRWTSIEGGVGHNVHVKRAELECLQCHHGELHAFQPRVEDCRRCHEDAVIKSAGMEDFHCVSCHDFKARERENLEPSSLECLECHGGKSATKRVVRTDDLPMNFDCAECHNPHRTAEPEPIDCLSCHADLLDDTGHPGSGMLTQCTSCHDVHHWKT